IIADEAYLTESMMEPNVKVVAGYQPLMPSYQGKLSGPEAAALVEYIKSLRSERTVQVTGGEE
ncbi:MAG: cytochrome c oxidase subunit II, partial [Myxococcaceae bacterium]